GRSPFGNAPFMVFVLIAFLTGTIFQQGLVALPIDMHQHGISPARFGGLIAINGVMIVLVQPFVVPWLQRLAPARVLAAGSILAGLGFGLTALASSAPVYGVSIAV